jgi:hypothetical protein
MEKLNFNFTLDDEDLELDPVTPAPDLTEEPKEEVTEEPAPTPEPEPEPEVDDISEEELERVAAQMPNKEVKEPIDAVKEFLKKHDLDPDHDLGVIKDVLDELNAIRKKNFEYEKAVATMEKNPMILKARLHEEATDMIKTNIATWESEFADVFPRYEEMLKLGKDKTQEVMNFVGRETRKLLIDRAIKGKVTSNPLLLLQNKINSELDRVTGKAAPAPAPAPTTKPQPQAKTVPPIQERKQTASLSSAASVIGNEPEIRVQGLSAKAVQEVKNNFKGLSHLIDLDDL